MGYSFRLTAMVLLYAPSHRQDCTYHGLCYTSRGTLAGTRNSSTGPPHEGSIRRPIAPRSYVSLCISQCTPNVVTVNVVWVVLPLWRKCRGPGDGGKGKSDGAFELGKRFCLCFSQNESFQLWSTGWNKKKLSGLRLILVSGMSLWVFNSWVSYKLHPAVNIMWPSSLTSAYVEVITIVKRLQMNYFYFCRLFFNKEYMLICITYIHALTLSILWPSLTLTST